MNSGPGSCPSTKHAVLVVARGRASRFCGRDQVACLRPHVLHTWKYCVNNGVVSFSVRYASTLGAAAGAMERGHRVLGFIKRRPKRHRQARAPGTGGFSGYGNATPAHERMTTWANVGSILSTRLGDRTAHGQAVELRLFRGAMSPQSHTLKRCKKNENSQNCVAPLRLQSCQHKIMYVYG